MGKEKVPAGHWGPTTDPHVGRTGPVEALPARSVQRRAREWILWCRYPELADIAGIAEVPRPEQGLELAARPLGALRRFRTSDSGKKKWRPWLQQLSAKMREAVRVDNMPEHIYKKNG